MLSARPAALPLDADRAKTPGRVLAKTRNVLQENATRVAPVTVIGKGRKGAENTPHQLKTLQTDRVSKGPPGKQVGFSKLKDTPSIRPLGDKTPFPNRTASQPSNTGAKIANLPLPDGSLRPSSARKHDRLPRSASKVFETPITNGKHWDVSDIDIDVDVPIANQSIEESYDEIEYMPPKVEEIPYEPPFEMPDYKEVGKSLISMIRSYTLEDDPPSNDLTFTADPSESNFFEAPTLPQPEIEDDSPFARSKPDPAVKPQPTRNSRSKSTITANGPKPTPRATVQPTASITRTTSLALRRPPTASSARLPTTMTAARKSVSQPVTRAPTAQSTARAPVSRATTRAPSTARTTPSARAGATPLCRTTSVTRPPIKPAARTTATAVTAPIKGKPTAIPPQPGTTPAARNDTPPFAGGASPNTTRPRSGTITKEAFESNTHIALHIRNNSLEDVKKDLEGLVVFGDDFDDEDGFRFEV